MKSKNDMEQDIWKYLDNWRLCEGRRWLGEDGTASFHRQRHNTGEGYPKTSGITVTFQVPPPRAAAASAFLRRTTKKVKAQPGDEYGLPSDLNEQLVYVAAENAKLVEALQKIRDSCPLIPEQNDDGDWVDDPRAVVVRMLSEAALEERGAGAAILERMRLQRELVLEKSVEISAQLLKQLDS